MGDLRKPQFSEEKRGFFIEVSANGQSNEVVFITAKNISKLFG